MSSLGPVDSIEAFRNDMLSRRGVDPGVVDRSGSLCIPEQSRADTGIASGYVYGAHFIVFCDPAIEQIVASFEAPQFAAGSAAPLDAFRSFASERGGEFLGSGTMRVLAESADPPPVTTPVVSLDRDVAADVARIHALVDACTDDEVDDAAIKLDDLNPEIRGTETAPGAALSAYASAFPDDDFAGRWDIGVLTHPDHRRQGLGRQAVIQLTADLVAEGQVPLYRHDLDNDASARLAASLGFVPATVLLACRFAV